MAANGFYKTAPKDGTAAGMFTGFALRYALKDEAILFDIDEMPLLGVQPTNQVTLIANSVGIDAPKDLLELDEPLLVGTSSRRAAPFRVRTIARDAFTEESVWSTLTIAYGPHRPAILNGITTEHLPRLQDTLLEHLHQMEQPRRPRIGLDVPAEYFPQLLAKVKEQATAAGRLMTDEEFRALALSERAA